MAKRRELGTAVEHVAETALSGHRIVAVINNKAVYADKDTLLHWTNIRGITTGSALQGADACIQVAGPLVEPSWNWTPDEPIYLGNDGVMTQTVPTTGAVIQIAVADTPTRIMIDRRLPIAN